MSYTIVADVCEGLHDCVPCCPAECISHGHGSNGKGTSFVVIDPAACTNCGICLSICPIEGAVLDEWRPELQTPGAPDSTPATANVAVPVDAAAALARARQLESDGDSVAAAAAYKQAIACGDDQHSAEAAYRLGNLLEQDRDSKNAALAVYVACADIGRYALPPNVRVGSRSTAAPDGRPRLGGQDVLARNGFPPR